MDIDDPDIFNPFYVIKTIAFLYVCALTILTIVDYAVRKYKAK